MTQNEIIRMAREAGAMFDHMTWVERDLAPVFERFAALVAAHERKNSAKMQGDCTLAALKLAEEALQRSKRNHYYCEDTWYSCPKAEDGCANDAEGDDCNCGADVLNAENDKALAAIREALAEQDKQEPVAWHEPNAYGNVTTHKKWAEENGWLPLYTKE